MIKIKKCGIYDSKLQFGTAKQTPERITQFYEIEYYLTDNGLSYIDDYTYPHSIGNILFIHPGQRRHSVESFKCYCLHFEATKELDEIFETVPNIINTVYNFKYKNVFEEIIKLYNLMGTTVCFELQSEIYKLFSMIHKDVTLTTNKKNFNNKIDPKLIYKAIEFIEKNISAPIRLADISKVVHLSPIYFHRIFTQYVGMTPNQFLTEKRIIAAKENLIKDDVSMSQVAELCGFSSQAYFSYVFQKECRMTTKEYRDKKYINNI